MKILFCTPEMTPYAKTGGLADVSAALPRAIEALGHECLVCLPHYRHLKDLPSEAVAEMVLPTGRGIVTARVRRADRIYLIENDDFFGRDGIYAYAERDFPDNLERFAFFSRACAALVEVLADVDVVHCNDWQTALVPAYLHAMGLIGPLRADNVGRKTGCLFTIHNLAYQGIFNGALWPNLMLPREYFNPEGLEFFGRINIMKAGIVFADMVNTVSPAYAAEIQTAAFGCGLDGLMRATADRLCGILNGIDTTVWNPADDEHLPQPYRAGDLAGKQACKQALQHRMGLSPLDRAPLFGLVGRLVPQKGIDLVLSEAEALVAEGAQLVILGRGDAGLEEGLRAAAARQPRDIGVEIGFDEELAHLIEAGSDFFLMPSRFEPCGLNQMISMRYGTIPLVTAVGGLRDTVTAPGEGAAPCGIRVAGPERASLRAAITRARDLYRHQPQDLLAMQVTAMQHDFAWSASALEYVLLFHKITNFKERISLS